LARPGTPQGNRITYPFTQIIGRSLAHLVREACRMLGTRLNWHGA